MAPIEVIVDRIQLVKWFKIDQYDNTVVALHSFIWTYNSDNSGYVYIQHIYSI